MGYKIYLSDYNALIHFLDYSQELQTWGTRKFSLVASSGISMVINTFTGGLDNEGYTQFASLKNYINQYYVNNGSDPITVDLKLVCPASYRKSVDQAGYYRNFFLNIYSSANVTYMTMSYEEQGKDLPEEPFIAWVAYVRRMYEKWKIYYEANEL